MTGTAARVAAGMRAIYPTPDDPDDKRWRDDPVKLEAARAMWGTCLGAMAEALMAAGELPQSKRFDFYRAAGLEIYD